MGSCDLLITASSGPVANPDVRTPCGFFAVYSPSSPRPPALWPPPCPSAPSAGLWAGRSHSEGFPRRPPAPAASSQPPPAAGSSRGAAPPGSPVLLLASHSGPLSCECQILGAGCRATAAPAVGRGARGRGAEPGPHVGGGGTPCWRGRRVQEPLRQQKLPAVCLRTAQSRSAAGWSEAGWVKWWGGRQDTSRWNVSWKRSTDKWAVRTE